MKFSSIAVLTMTVMTVGSPSAAWVVDRLPSKRLVSSLSPSSLLSRPAWQVPSRTGVVRSSSSSDAEAGVDTRQAYIEWCQYYGKTPSDERFSIFATNFLTQWNYDQQQQRPTSTASVNEFADWTAEEFQQRQMAVETKIHEIYQQWCRDYGKPAVSGTRYETFKANFLQNMKYYEQTGDFYQLNQYADLTYDEYQTRSDEDQATATATAATTESEDEGAGLPSYLQGILQAATQQPYSTTTSMESGVGMSSYTDALSSNSGVSASKPASYLPKSSWTSTPTTPTASSFLTPAGPGQPSNPFSSPWSSPPSSYQEPTLESQPPQATSSSSGSGAGMAFYTDALSGSSAEAAPKPASYLPNKSYRPSSGSGMPSYFDNLSGASYDTPSFADFNEPTPMTLPPLPPTVVSGAGMPSYTDALTGTNSALAPKPASYMPNKSYQPSSGSGMPSYFDSMSGTAPPKPASFMPNRKSYNQPLGIGMSPSYFDNMNAATATPSTTTSSWSPAQPAYQEPSLESQPPQAMSLTSHEATGTVGDPLDGAGMTSHTDALSGGGASAGFKSASYMPSKSYKASSGSGMASYFDNLSSVPPKPASYMPNSKTYKSSAAGSGMPSYFDNLPSSSESPSYPTRQFMEPTPPLDGRPDIAPAPEAPLASLPPSGSGMASYVVPSDQSAEFKRQHIPTRGGPGQPLAYKMQNPQVQPSDQSLEFIRRRRVEAMGRNMPLAEFPLAHALKNPQLLQSDQHLIMREGEGFLPHALDPVIRRGNLLPDQFMAASNTGFFFTGQVSQSARPLDVATTRFPSDQEKADVYARQRLMYFQKGPNVGRVGGYSKHSSTNTNKDGRRNGSERPNQMASVSKMNQKSSFMPTSYKKTSGSGMPSYFDNF